MNLNDSMVGLGGLEPPTSRLSGVRSNHLSYKPICLSFLAMTVLLSVAAVLMYASTLRASLPQRLVLSKKSCAFCLSFYEPTALLLVLCGAHIHQYAPFLETRAPCIFAKILRIFRACFF